MKRIMKILIYSVFVLLLLSCTTDFSSEAVVAIPVTASYTEESASETDSGTENADYEDEPYDDGVNYEVLEDETIPAREWTIMLYMAADNNLEGAAITDFNELENADFDESVTVLILLDRAENYDATNGDWQDTRLFKLCHDDNKNKALIVSENLDCQELGLSRESLTELDMANPQTMVGFIEYSRSSFPAENYALLIWGHGTGWRGADTDLTDIQNSCRAFAVDGTSSTYMTISQLSSAISEGMGDEKLSVLAFDTCFGLCLESAYEFSDCADYMLGTPSIVPESGWNYTGFLNQFAQSDKSLSSFIASAAENFCESYKNYAYAAFSCVDLKKIPALVDSFSDYASGLASEICSRQERDEIFSLFESECVSYCSPLYPTDFYVDLADILLALDSHKASEAVLDLLSQALVFDWSASGATASLGLFFCVYKSAGVISSSHPSLYVNGSRETSLSRFVKDCPGYVPTISLSGSLLDKLFYEAFQ